MVFSGILVIQGKNIIFDLIEGPKKEVLDDWHVSNSINKLFHYTIYGNLDNGKRFSSSIRRELYSKIIDCERLEIIYYSHTSSIVEVKMCD